MSADQTYRTVDTKAGIDAVLRALLKRAIINCSSHSREQIADELTARLHRKISPPTLDAWTAETKQAWHLPADAVPVLCEILQDDALQRQLLSPKMREHLEDGEWLSAGQPRLEKLLAELRRVTRSKR